MTELQGQTLFKNLALTVESFKMGLFGGLIRGTAHLQMAPKIPTYRFNADVTSLDIQQAVSSQFALFKNTLTGIATFKIEGTGFSFNPEPAKKNLNAKGKLRVDHAKFATIDIAKMVGEGISKSLDGLSGKIPALKGKTVNIAGNIDSLYAFIASDFTIAGGKFMAPNFVAKAEPGKGLDLKGDTQVGLTDYALNANWEVVDTYNITRAKDLSVEQQGIRVEHILANADGAVHIPVKVCGTVFAPQFNYSALSESLGRVALINIGKALTGKAKSELQKKIQEQISSKAPPQLQEALKKFGGKLFGN